MAALQGLVQALAALHRRGAGALGGNLLLAGGQQIGFQHADAVVGAVAALAGVGQFAFQPAFAHQGFLHLAAEAGVLLLQPRRTRLGGVQPHVGGFQVDLGRNGLFLQGLG